jgi:hypothetical protein
MAAHTHPHLTGRRGFSVAVGMLAVIVAAAHRARRPPGWQSTMANRP